jgi:hypothetical protein
MALTNVSIVGNTAPPRGLENVGKGGGLYQDFGSFPSAVTTARSVLVARNVNGGCGGTANDPIDSDNGLIDEPLPATTCQAVGDGNLIVADALVAGLADNGGPTRTHALLAGSPAIDAGAGCPADDQRGTTRPQGSACDIGAYEYVPPPPQQGGGGGGTTQPPPPPVEDDEQLPPPEAGEEVNALPKSGTVRVKIAGTNRFVELQAGQQIPVGSIVDTRKGRVTIVAAGNQSADFYDGIFRLTQGKGARPLTTLTLVEALSCPKAGRAVAAAKRKRRLWGDGSGRFRTKGRHSAATVVGTRWLVEDRCASTLTRVVRGRGAGLREEEDRDRARRQEVRRPRQALDERRLTGALALGEDRSTCADGTDSGWGSWERSRRWRSALASPWPRTSRSTRPPTAPTRSAWPTARCARPSRSPARATR